MKLNEIRTLSNYTYFHATGYDAEENQISLTIFIFDKQQMFKAIAMGSSGNQYEKEYSRCEKTVVFNDETLREFYLETVTKGKLVERENAA